MLDFGAELHVLRYVETMHRSRDLGYFTNGLGKTVSKFANKIICLFPFVVREIRAYCYCI